MVQNSAATLAQHVAELRNRLTVVVLTFLIATGICYCFAGEIYQFLIRPLEIALGDAHRRMIYTHLAEGFLTYLKLACFGGAVISFPVLFYQAYRFLAPGLYQNEKQILLPILIAAPVLFAVGALFVFYGVMPTAWKFFLSFETADTAQIAIQLEPKISEYLALTMTLILAFGFAFQLPLVLIILCLMGVVTPQMLAKRRKYAILLIFIVAAILTPPDFLSQVGLALPLMLLYEVAILISKFIKKKHARHQVDSIAPRSV